MDLLRQVWSVFLSNDENHKKNDDLIETTEDSYIIPMEEDPEQDAQEFIQETLDYFKGNLKCVDDLKMGLGRTGDGIETEILWWTPIDHPVGAMLDQNPQIVSKCVIDAGRHGKVAIYTDPNVRLCIEEIVTMLEKYRSIKLTVVESDQEKPQTISAPIKSD